MCVFFQGRLDELDVNKAVQFVVKCMNFDGGFGRVPGSESHAGQARERERVVASASSLV